MPDTTASLAFLAKLPTYDTEKPYTIIPSADRLDVKDADRTNVEIETHDGIKLTDIRDWKADVNLDTHGFQVLSHVTKYPRLDKLSQCKGYKKETADFLEKHFGADRVITWDLRPTQKRHVIKYQKGGNWDYTDLRETEGPAVMAHSGENMQYVNNRENWPFTSAADFTFESGLMIIGAYLTGEEKAKYLNGKYRIRLVNTWRAMVPVVERQPLALCDPRSVLPEQMISCDRILCDTLGEVYLLQHHPENKWYWLEHQTSSEPYLILTWDSEAGGHARCEYTNAIVLNKK
ncbi:Fc.00g112940.m01.CDS01 [Cosmosporella sp. VM-42]